MQRFAIDVHILDADDDEAVRELRRLNAGGEVDLVRSDAMDTELNKKQDEGRRGELLERSSELEEVPGVLIWDRSRWDHTLWGSEETAATFDEVWTILWGDYSRTGPETNNRRTRTFDTMHIHSAIINNCFGFITRDGDLLRRSAAIRDRFGLAVVKPEEALALVRGNHEADRT